MPTLPIPSESKAEFTVVEPGVYTLEFTNYDGPMTSNYDPDKETIQLEFTVRDDDEFDGSKIKQYYGFTMHPTMSKLYPVVKALLGGTIDDDAELELSDLIGRKVLGTIDTVTKPRKDNPKEMSTFARLVSAAPLRRSRSRVAEGAEAKSPFTRAAQADNSPQGTVDDADDDADWAAASS